MLEYQCIRFFLVFLYVVFLVHVSIQVIMGAQKIKYFAPMQRNWKRDTLLAEKNMLSLVRATSQLLQARKCLIWGEIFMTLLRQSVLPLALSVHNRQGLEEEVFFFIIPLECLSLKQLTLREKAQLRGHSKMYLNDKGEEIKGKSLVGADAIGIPGLVAGVLEIHQKYGKLSREQVLAPAIELAEKGFKVYPELAFALNYKEKDLSQFPSTIKIFFRNGKPLKEGDLLVQKDLGERYDELQMRKKMDFTRDLSVNLLSK